MYDAHTHFLFYYPFSSSGPLEGYKDSFDLQPLVEPTTYPEGEEHSVRRKQNTKTTTGWMVKLLMLTVIEAQDPHSACMIADGAKYAGTL